MIQLFIKYLVSITFRCLLTIDSAIHQIFDLLYPIHCAYYITQNLHKNLRKLLGDTYQKFLKDFYSCRNCYNKDEFERWFDQLLHTYASVRSYLEFFYKFKNF